MFSFRTIAAGIRRLVSGNRHLGHFPGFDADELELIAGLVDKRIGELSERRWMEMSLSEIDEICSLERIVGKIDEYAKETDESTDGEILESVEERMERSKPLPAEFARVVDEEFWNLVF